MKTPVTQMRSYLPLRIKSEAVDQLSSLPQFQGIPDNSLIRLAKRRTGLKVPDRLVAIALILGNRIPIPVPAPKIRKDVHADNEVTAPPKLILIRGGRIAR